MKTTKRKSPFDIDEKNYKRYDERKHPLCKTAADKKYRYYNRDIEEKMSEILKEKKPGYSRIDYALDSAAWTLYETFKLIPEEKIRGLGEHESYKSLPKYNVENREKMSKIIKKVASFFGASLTGIAHLDERWVYLYDCDGNKIEIPKECRYAIVMVVEMDPVALGSSPSVTSATATALGYSQSTFLVMHLGEFIKSLGHHVIKMVNDTALSIPLAIDAGLGQLGRNGLLITKEYGPRVRICKIFTDLPLKVDHPIDFGVTDFCKKCKECAEACEADAISFDDEPSFETKCSANNPCVKKWYIDGEKCYDFWYENSMDCATCITVCPFSKMEPNTPKDFWDG